MPAQGIIYNIQRMSTQDGPGLRTTIFFKGCPLHCLWCSNPESQALHPQLMFFPDLCVGCGRCMEACNSGAILRKGSICDRKFSRCTNCGSCAEICPTTAASISGKPYSVKDVMHIVEKDASFYFNSGGGVTFSGGECTLQGVFLLELLEACHREGLHTCVDTCGCTDPGLFRQVMDKADLFLFDMKHMDDAQHRQLVGVGNSAILTNLRILLATCPEKARIRIPLIPGFNDSKENIAAVADFLRPFQVRQVDVLPCHSYGRNKYEALHKAAPDVQEYRPEELRTVLARFSTHGLETEIVK
ncbi:glycyl-radical enzyme activating protein [uncultured Desulfovibrio sp.]|uniref:glycyl-radical enzyme activating protein n=1 Tax=uncultured Desulfovibrio sp. TaxID=167968 RepID=UPI0003B75311|nr:glycyl-radical enzyme activating protein [uncultured Desulfovibrio sp.]